MTRDADTPGRAELSPTRAANFATLGDPVIAAVSSRYRAPPPPPPSAAAPEIKPSPPRAPAAAAEAKPQEAAPATTLVVKIGRVTRAVAAGTTIEPMHLGMAGAGRGHGPIAEIVPNPNDPSVLGLRNLSDRTYRATMPDGKAIEIARGETARLVAGVIIDFGGIEGTVQAR